jgi:hypothetical protein
MKLLGAMLVLTASRVLAQSAEEPTPARRPRLTAAMMQQSTSARAVETDNDADALLSTSATAPAGVTMMAPFAVTTSALPSQITHDRPIMAAPAEHAFDWRNGGTVSRQDGDVFTVKAGVDYDPEFNVLNLLKISW